HDCPSQSFFEEAARKRRRRREPAVEAHHGDLLGLLATRRRPLPLRGFDRYLDGSRMFCPMSTGSAPACLKYALQNSVTFRCSATVSGWRSFVAPRPTPATCTSAFLSEGINLSFCNLARS